MNGRLTLAQRASDKIAEFCGSWLFVIVFSLLSAVWITFNTIWLMFGAFDPYPFIFFNLVLTIVSTFQGPIIMMSQNRQVERDRDTLLDLHAKFDELKSLLNPAA